MAADATVIVAATAVAVAITVVADATTANHAGNEKCKIKNAKGKMKSSLFVFPFAFYIFNFSFPRSGRDLQLQGLRAAHNLYFVFLSGLHLAERVGVIIDVAHFASGNPYDSIASFESGF